MLRGLPSVHVRRHLASHQLPRLIKFMFEPPRQRIAVGAGDSDPSRLPRRADDQVAVGRKPHKCGVGKGDASRF